MRNFDYIRDLGLDKLHYLCSATEETQVNNAIAVSFGLHEGIRRGEEAPHDPERLPMEAPGREIRVHHNPIGDPKPPKETQKTVAERPNTAAASTGGKDQQQMNG